MILQQTTVAVGKARFPALLTRFPSVDDFARASESDVLAAWSGLGYYARARNLLAASREAAARGGIPRSAAGLTELRGVGPYTAAAVASIAFGEPVAAVDANVARVVARLFAVPGDVRAPAVRARVRRAAEALLDAAHPGDHNQALMDLGAAVCTPRAPACGSCPLTRGCLALAGGSPARFGLAPRRVAPRKIALAAGVAFRAGKLLLVADETLVRGHLTVPLHELRDGEEPAEALARAWPAVAGARARALEPLGTVRHSVLERRYTVRVFRVTESGRRGGPGVLVAPDEIAEVPRGGLTTKVLRLLDEERKTASRLTAPGHGIR